LAPDTSIEILQALKVLAEEVEAGQASIEEADKKAGEISPALQGIFSKFGHGAATVFLGVVAGLIANRIDRPRTSSPTVIDNSVTVNYTLTKNELMNTAVCGPGGLKFPPTPRLKPKRPAGQ